MIPHTYPNEAHKGHRLMPRPPITPQFNKRFNDVGPRQVLQDRLDAAFRRVLRAAIAKYGERTADNPEGIDPAAMAEAASQWAGENRAKHR